MRRKICVVTGSRAEYGLLRWVMQGIRDSNDLSLQVIATGMHLSPEFGLTYKEIERDGFQIDRKVETLLSSDSNVGLAKAMGLGLISFADTLDELRPDLLLVLGDRFEILPVVAAALVLRLPVAHLHGGEVTEGAFDDAIRHSVTKMSHIHFVATEEYRGRVIQLGEDPANVFCVGGLGLDNIRKLTLLDRPTLERELQFPLGARNLLVTFHPATLAVGSAVDELAELLSALETLPDTHLFFTMPNADTEGRALYEKIRLFVASHPNSRVYKSLGSLVYLSCMKHMDAVVGNSSSGLIEAPSFSIGTVNIGSRQNGRLKASSVIDCGPSRAAIVDAIERLYSTQFQEQLLNVRNPYGDGGASKRIVDIIRSCSLTSLLEKRFHDLSRPAEKTNG